MGFTSVHVVLNKNQMLFEHRPKYAEMEYTYMRKSVSLTKAHHLFNFTQFQKTARIPDLLSAQNLREKVSHGLTSNQNIHGLTEVFKARSLSIQQQRNENCCIVTASLVRSQ